MSLSAINTDSWQWCLGRLEDELPSQQFNTWIRPLLADTSSGGVTLSAPNRFIRDFVEERYAAMISQILSEAGIKGARVSVVVGANPATPSQPERGDFSIWQSFVVCNELLSSRVLSFPPPAPW